VLKCKVVKDQINIDLNLWSKVSSLHVQSMSCCWCCSDYSEHEYHLSGHNPEDAVWVSDRVEVLTPRGLNKLQSEMSMDCQCRTTETYMTNPVQLTFLHDSPDIYDTENHDHNYVIVVEKSHVNEEVSLILWRI